MLIAINASRLLSDIHVISFDIGQNWKQILVKPTGVKFPTVHSDVLFFRV